MAKAKGKANAEDADKTVKASKPKVAKINVFARIGRFIRQTIDELLKVVTPTGKELLAWSFAVFVFVLILMGLVTAMDFGLGKLVLWMFG